MARVLKRQLDRPRPQEKPRPLGGPLDSRAARVGGTPRAAAVRSGKPRPLGASGSATSNFRAVSGDADRCAETSSASHRPALHSTCKPSTLKVLGSAALPAITDDTEDSLDLGISDLIPWLATPKEISDVEKMEMYPQDIHLAGEIPIMGSEDVEIHLKTSKTFEKKGENNENDPTSAIERNGVQEFRHRKRKLLNEDPDHKKKRLCVNSTKYLENLKKKDQMIPNQAEILENELKSLREANENLKITLKIDEKTIEMIREGLRNEIAAEYEKRREKKKKTVAKEQKKLAENEAKKYGLNQGTYASQKCRVERRLRIAESDLKIVDLEFRVEVEKRLKRKLLLTHNSDRFSSF